MSDVREQVRSLWIPLREVNMLLPHVAVAEVGSFRVPAEQPDTPDWLLGGIDWRGETIPVISLELLCGDEFPANPVYSRLVIVNSVHADSPLRHYAIVAAALPRSVQIDGDSVDDFESCQLPAIHCRVYIGRDQAVIPNLDYLEELLEQHWPAAA
jgi:chemosensory pili system protein ChpC